MTTPSFTVDAVTTTYKPVMGGYSGYAYQEELSVQKLLGKDPRRPDGNEVLQSTGLGSRVATVDIYATSAERDVLESILWRRVSHDDGIDAARMAVITKVSSALYHKVGAKAPVFKVSVTLHEQRDVFFARDTFTSLMAWYKADDLIGTYADGDKINAWPDASGNGHNLVYDTINKVPKFKRYAVAGAMPAGDMDYGGVDNTYTLKTAARIGDFLGTAICVAASPSNGADAPAIARDDAGSHPRIITYYDANTKLFEGNSDDLLKAAASGDLPRWIDRIETGPGRYDIGNTNYHVVSSSSIGAVKAMDGTRTFLFYGNASFHGKIAEALFFSTRLTTDQRLYVETYLKTKYAL